MKLLFNTTIKIEICCKRPLFRDIFFLKIPEHNSVQVLFSAIHYNN